MLDELYFGRNPDFTRARKTVHLDAWSFLTEYELGNSIGSQHNCKICISLKQNEHHIKLSFGNFFNPDIFLVLYVHNTGLTYNR